MILLLVCLCVPASLYFWWRMCAVASYADDRMEAEFQEMMREKQSDTQAESGFHSVADPPGKEDADAG